MKPITSKEADAIEAALLTCQDVAAVAARFGRKRRTIVRFRFSRLRGSSQISLDAGER